ncbi:hypothetical protein Q9L58_005214 [Maublancomyces gigas]|uniref:GPI anchored protein n=1 Tax=Discina gigas TaxID=1032678 RepID=A0ABR3GIV8_9PEZI
MLSKILVSALLVLQTSFVAADDTTGRKGFGINARGLLVRQSTCPAGSFMCDDNTGCCDIGTTCGYRASDNYPICKGASCNGGPICQSGLCCDLGYLCNESTKLCTKDTGTGPVSSPVVSSTPSSTKASSSTKAASSTKFFSMTKSSPATSSTASLDDFDSSSSADDSTTDTIESSSTTRSSPTTRRTSSTTDVFDFGSPTSTSTGLPSGPPLAAGAEGLSGSVGKVVLGAVAGVLAFVL